MHNAMHTQPATMGPVTALLCRSGRRGSARAEEQQQQVAVESRGGGAKTTMCQSARLAPAAQRAAHRPPKRWWWFPPSPRPDRPRRLPRRWPARPLMGHQQSPRTTHWGPATLRKPRLDTNPCTYEVVPVAEGRDAGESKNTTSVAVEFGVPSPCWKRAAPILLLTNNQHPEERRTSKPSRGRPSSYRRTL